MIEFLFQLLSHIKIIGVFFTVFVESGKEEEDGEGPLPNLHLSFSDLFTTEQTSVMQLEHCSSIGKNNNRILYNNNSNNRADLCYAARTLLIHRQQQQQQQLYTVKQQYFTVQLQQHHTLLYTIQAHLCNNSEHAPVPL